MSDIPSLSEKEEQGGTLQFPNVKATQLRQSIPNKNLAREDISGFALE